MANPEWDNYDVNRKLYSQAELDRIMAEAVRGERQRCSDVVDRMIGPTGGWLDSPKRVSNLICCPDPNPADPQVERVTPEEPCFYSDCKLQEGHPGPHDPAPSDAASSVTALGQVRQLHDCYGYEHLNVLGEPKPTTLLDAVAQVEKAASWARFHIEERGRQNDELREHERTLREANVALEKELANRIHTELDACERARQLGEANVALVGALEGMRRAYSLSTNSDQTYAHIHARSVLDKKVKDGK